MNQLVLCFFFSSRRRHTRLQGDWSSDVCSSDLRAERRGMPKPKAGRASRIRLPLKLKLSLLITALLVVTVTFLSAFLLYRAERSLIAQMTKRGLTIAQHLANAAKNPLLNDDGLTLNLLVKDAMNDADVAYAIVTDHDGKIVAHPDVTLIGRPLERPTGLARLGDDLLIQTYTDS